MTIKLQSYTSLVPGNVKLAEQTNLSTVLKTQQNKMEKS